MAVLSRGSLLHVPMGRSTSVQFARSLPAMPSTQQNKLCLVVMVLERAPKALFSERFRAVRSLESKTSGSSGNSMDAKGFLPESHSGMLFFRLCSILSEPSGLS